ncbi:MAG: hypothetical protein GEV05_23160 [Betaproteobacteria bacterium]|nr:hypothetical protein [Betaproteobacteria bacterium]
MIRIPKQIRRNAHPFLVIFATLYIVFVFCPVYVARADQHPLDGTLLTLVVLAVLAASTLACAILSLSRVDYKYIEPVLTATLLLFFVFATLIPRQAGMLDGQELTGKAPPNWYWMNLLAWLLLVVVAWKLRRRLHFVAVPILLLCWGYTLYDRHLAISVISVPTSQEVSKHKHDLGVLSSKQNVVVLAVDMLQGSIVEKVLKEHPRALSAFDGFTVFTRALTSFPFTNFAKPAILSGKTYATRDSGAVTDHWAAAEQDSFATDLMEHGYLVRSVDFLYTLGRDAQLLSASSSGFLGQDERTLSHAAYAYGFAFAAGIARIIGVWPTNPFFGQATDYILSHKLRSVAVARDLSQLIRREEDIAPRALFFWNYSAHTPVALDREGKVSPKSTEDEAAIEQETLLVYDQLESLFASMKDASVYDNSLIIIVSDHGHPLLATKEHLREFSGLENGHESGGNYVPVSLYNATLWIKPPFARDPAIITGEPAWNGDVRQVINSYLAEFSNRDPRTLLRSIRSASPDIEVLYLSQVQENPQNNSRSHEFVRARSLEELYEAFVEQSKEEAVESAP